MATIDIRAVSKAYGSHAPVLRDIDLSIGDGEFVVLVGPSGCGKSTLLRMVVGLEDITSGELLIDGSRVNDLSPKDRNLSMVFQNYALYPHLSVFENIAFPLRLAKGKHSEEEIDAKVREAANALGYRPNVLARAMLTGKSKIIGLVVAFAGVVIIAFGFSPSDSNACSSRAIWPSVSRRCVSKLCFSSGAVAFSIILGSALVIWFSA